MKHNLLKQMINYGAVLPISITLLASCANTENNVASSEKTTAVESIPADKFDLSHWKMNVPVDLNNDGKIDTITVKEMQTYAHPDFFYLDENGGMVFAAPNKALTSAIDSRAQVPMLLTDLRSLALQRLCKT